MEINEGETEGPQEIGTEGDKECTCQFLDWEGGSRSSRQRVYGAITKEEAHSFIIRKRKAGGKGVDWPREGARILVIEIETRKTSSRGHSRAYYWGFPSASSPNRYL